MSDVLLIAVAVWAGLVLVAACGTVLHRRTERLPTPAHGRRGAVAGLAVVGTAGRPESTAAGSEPESTAAGSEAESTAAGSEAESTAAGSEPEASAQDGRPDGPAEPGQADGPAEPGQADGSAEPGQAAEVVVSGPGTAEPGPHPSVAEPDGRHSGAEICTVSERIARFYEEADRPVASLLGTLGWSQGQRAPGSEHRNASASFLPGNQAKSTSGRAVVTGQRRPG